MLEEWIAGTGMSIAGQFHIFLGVPEIGVTKAQAQSSKPRRASSGKLVAALFVAGILFVTGTVLIRQWRVIAQLQRENQTLRGEIQAREQAGTSDAAQAMLDEELRRLRAEAQEVHKLRNEVSQFRAQRSELDKLLTENQRLKTAPVATVSSVVQNAQQPEYFAKENWTFAGYATPEAALQTFLWAMRQADLKTLQASVTAEDGPEKEGLTNPRQLWKRRSKGKSKIQPASASSSGKPFLKQSLSCGSTRTGKEAAVGIRILS